MGMKRIPATVTVVAFFVAAQVILGIREGDPVHLIVLPSVATAIIVVVVLWFFFRITGRGR